MESLKRTGALLASLLVCFALDPMLADVAAADPVSVAPASGIEQVAPRQVIDPKTVVDAAARKAVRATGDAAVQALQGDATSSAVPQEEPEEEEPKLCDIATIAEVFRDYQKVADPEQIRKIQLQLKIGGFDPREIDGVAGPDTDAAFAQLCVDHKVEEFFKAKDYADPSEAKQRLAAHLVGLLFEPTINLSGGDCGCSRNFSAEVVYGFYPFLLTGGETQQVDFGLLDRIGFHALVLDATGEIQDDLKWRSDNGNVADFIHEAHRHRVKVDLTFYASDWGDWKFGEISKVAKNIAGTANLRFKKTNRPIWHNILRLIGGSSSQSVDGVNLYFEFDKNPGSSKKLQEIITQVSDKLEDTGSQAALNIILGLHPSGIDRLKIANLANILVRDTTAVDKVFIFLPQNSNASAESRKNTSRAKKLLRQKIEQAFNGRSRQIVLRKIVPIISPVDIDHEPLSGSAGRESQFDDDLVYFEDNFAGVGLWPLPLESAKAAEQISKALITQLRYSENPTYLGEKLEQYAPQVCQFVCPNRLLVYILLGLLVAVLLTFALLTLFNCRLREVYKRFFLVFLALGMLIPLVIAIAFSCDPEWADDVDALVIAFLVLILAGFVWRSVRKASRPKLP